MKLHQRIIAFSELGRFMDQFTESHFSKKETVAYNELFFQQLADEITHAKHYNPWFTLDNLMLAFQSWSESLTLDNLTYWTGNYNFTNDNKPKTIGLIMAGNIPLVGFHDLLSVLITGNKALVKLASNDKKILPILIQYLIKIEPEFCNMVEFTEEKLTNFEAVIATGSNNSARYFEYYFGKYPNIIRKNRNSVAVLTGKETEEELTLLANDIFQYFGLGCRSVSKIFVPKNYNFDQFFKAIDTYKNLLNYKKYSNNYDYNKAVYLMSLFPILDNGFLLLKEDISYTSPIATLSYEYYDTLAELAIKLSANSEQLQCIVSSEIIQYAIPFGSTQSPDLWDYADGIDTIDFLLKLT